jgi:hypothetical protein
MDMPSSANTYCARLNIPVRRVEDFLDKKDVKLVDLLIVALLERGGPATLEQIADRLSAAGVQAGTDDMVYSLKKAWHGMQPVYRAPDGRLGLDLASYAMRRVLFKLNWEERRPAPSPPLPEPEVLPDDVPLSEDELRWAFGQRSISSVSGLRQAAAVLDARREPMTVEDLESYLSKLTPHRSRLSADLGRWRKSYLRVDAEGRLSLEATAPEVPAMRRAVRTLARAGQMEEAIREQQHRYHEVRKAELAVEQEQARREAARLRRAVLRIVPDQGPPAAAALLDVAARAIKTFVGDELAQLPAAIAAFDLVAALRVREALYSAGISDPDRFRLVDLQSPQKTRRLNRQGRCLTITPEMLITSSTGISRPLGEPARLAAYLAEGAEGKLRRRIESDVKALFAFYNYGVLHGHVRLRWGFLDEGLPVDWALPGDMHVYEVLNACRAAGRPVDLVWGSAPGWADPWSRARSARVIAVDSGCVVVESEGQQWSLSRDEIQAVRPTAEERPG